MPVFSLLSVVNGGAILKIDVISNNARLVILIREKFMKKALAIISMLAFIGVSIAQSATGTEASGGAAGGTASGGAGAGAAGGAGAGAGAAAGGLSVAAATAGAIGLAVAVSVANDDSAVVSTATATGTR